MALMPTACVEGCVEGLQRSIAVSWGGTCPSTSGVANLSQERRDQAYGYWKKLIKVKFAGIPHTSEIFFALSILIKST